MSYSLEVVKAESNQELSHSQLVITHLSEIVNQYLDDHPRITLNGLSKRCQVSEPTIRRIAKKQIKTLPNLSTVLDLLMTISKKTEIVEILDCFPGPVADFVREALPYAEEHGSEHSNTIHKYLQDPVKYLIFKLSLNRIGVSEEKVRRLFGDLGVSDLKDLVKYELIEERQGLYFAKIKHFTTIFENFVDQFRATANFIKPHTYQSRKPLNPLFVNASDSVSPEAYKEISRIQKAALKKISRILAEDESAGPIPLVFLCALDTLDTQSALDIANDIEN